MGDVALLLQQVGREGSPAPYDVGASQWWAWAACFLVGIVGFSVMGLRATPKGRGHFAPKILVVLTAMTSYIAVAFDRGTDKLGETTYFSYARYLLLLRALYRLGDHHPPAPARAGAARHTQGTGLVAPGAQHHGRGPVHDLDGALRGPLRRGPRRVVGVVPRKLAGVPGALRPDLRPAGPTGQGEGQGGDEMQKSGDPVERYLGAIHSGEGKWFVPMAGLLALIWLVYPVNFFLDEQGIGVYTHPVSDAVYTVADVTAKVIYGFVLLGGVLAIERRAAPRRRWARTSGCASRPSSTATRATRSATNPCPSAWAPGTGLRPPAAVPLGAGRSTRRAPAASAWTIATTIRCACIARAKANHTVRRGRTGLPRGPVGRTLIG